jgi:hypothetical protein
MTEPADQGPGAPSVRVPGAVRPYPRGQLQDLQERDGGKGVANLHQEGTDQEVSNGVLAEPAS